jgi:hypothetical protein
LHFFNNVQAGVHDELIHGPLLFVKLEKILTTTEGRGGNSCGTHPGCAIAALFGGPEFGFVEGVVFGADYGEVVAHISWGWTKI